MSICLINGELEEDQAVGGEQNEYYGRLSLKNH